MNTYKNRLKVQMGNNPGLVDDFIILTAVAGFRDFVSLDNDNLFEMLIVDGINWEIRRDCLYTHSTRTLSRGTLVDSSTGTACDFTSSAILANILPAERILPVMIESPSAGQAIQFDGTDWVNADIPTGSSLATLSDVHLGTLFGDEIIKYNGITSKWENRYLTFSIQQLDYVQIISPIAEQYLKFDGTNWVNTAFPYIPSQLSDLSDITLTSSTNNDVLTYNGVKWINRPVDIRTTLDSLDNVVFGPEIADQVLQYNGTNWTNTTLPTITLPISSNFTNPSVALGTDSFAIGSAAGANGKSSIALGTYASAPNDGELTICNGGFSDLTKTQYSTYILHAKTTAIDGASFIDLKTGDGTFNDVGSMNITLPNDPSVYLIKLDVIGSAHDGTCAIWKDAQMIIRKESILGDGTLLSSATNKIYSDNTSLELHLNIASDVLVLQVKGDSTQDIKWIAKVTIMGI